MKERLDNLDIEEALKKDLDEFMDACHEFASCMPESVVNKPGVLMGFGRQLFFFKCFKVRRGQHWAARECVRTVRCCVAIPSRSMVGYVVSYHA